MVPVCIFFFSNLAERCDFQCFPTTTSFWKEENSLKIKSYTSVDYVKVISVTQVLNKEPAIPEK